MKRSKRLLSLLLSAVLLLGLLPVTTLPASAEGTTHKISSFAELKYYADASQNINYEGDTFLLMNDITLTEENLTSLSGKPLYFGNHNCYFKGTFDGQGHTISGLKFETGVAAEVNTALFAHTDGATIKNLVIANADLDADLLGGILIGHALNTHVENILIKDSNLSVDCADNALTLITDGGMVAGALIGKAEDSTIYNCEVSNTYVHTAATGAIQALGGKGLYMGALVGWAKNSTIEYCRTINGTRVKNYYDVAVGALGGNKVYAGGIAGELSGTSKVIDCFSTADLYTYCATYVSVGAGNVGYVGGISAAVYGMDCEITRCHYAGNATSRQYNAILVIPIIQNNINVSGISQRYEGGKVTGSYFRPSDSPDTTMNVLGDTTATAEYGPQEDGVYTDRSFWAGHDYDFAGTVERSSSYSTSHTNKWVMDYEHGMPIHGQSVAAGFDFPDAGSVTIGKTNLIGTEVKTDNAYDFAVQAFSPNTNDALTLTAATGDGYRFVSWYRIPDVTASSAPEGHEYFAELMALGEIVSTEAAFRTTAYEDNDLFLAHMEALVTFHDISGDAIDRTTGEDSEDTGDDWYDFEEALPDVTPTAHVPESETARLIGWTTVPGGYASIANDELTRLRLAGDFYETGDPVEKPMDLYPVYADLISNVITVHEGNEQDGSTDKSLREGVGSTWATIGDDNTATIHVTGAEADGAFPEGYRFLGWYTDDGNGNEVRISQERDYKLTGVDLGTQHVYTARFEYRVQFWLPQKVDHALGTRFGFTFSKMVAEEYVTYDTLLFTSEWDSAYINDSVYTIAPSGKSNYQWKFVAWTDEDIRFESDGTTLKVYRQQYAGTDPYVKLINSANEIKYDITAAVVAPLELSGLFQHPDPYAQRSAYLYTDFPNSALLTQTAVTTIDEDRTVQAQIADGYNFVFWSMYGIATDNSSAVNVQYADSAAATHGTLTFNADAATAVWATKVTVGIGNDINRTHYYIAHNTADVNFHTAAGDLIQHDTVSVEDFPYLTADKPVTMTRRYQSEVFGTANNTYSGDGNSDMSKDPTNYTSTKAELGTPATAEEAKVDGYLFIGWAEPARMQDYECAYAFDLANGISVEGKPQYISSSVDKAKAYTLTTSALVEHAMELYPVYVPLGQITTKTNLPEPEKVNFSVPRRPGFTYTDGTGETPGPNGEQSIKLQADMTTRIPDSEDTYNLLYMTISIDGGEETVLPAGSTAGEYTYGPVLPGHSYLFTAYYEPYVVVFHQNGTSETVTQRYNRYDHIRNTPLPTVQDVYHDLDEYLFIGWTEQVPENGRYLTYEAGTNEEVTYDKMDDIYHFVDDGTSVSHAMELWPVYINIRIQVNSNIDAELTQKGVDLNTIRKVDRNAADSLQTKVVATEVEGYKFYGWYKGIPADQLTDDTLYTDDKLVSKDSSYHLTGDKPYEPTVYTARYIKVYKVIYHDLAGDVLETEYVYETDDHAFVMEQTLTDANGNPLKNEDGSNKTAQVLYNSIPFYAIHETMTTAQTFDTWVWVKADGEQSEFSEFCQKKIIGECFNGTSTREMHLYPIVWTLSAKDSTGADYDKLIVSGSFGEGDDSVNAYFDGETAYDQPSLTVHVEKNKWTGSGSSATSGSDNQQSVPVTLYPDSNSEAVAIDTQPTNSDGNATFYFNAASLTIEKTGGAELAGQTFLFTVKGEGITKTVSVTCVASEDGTSASGSVTLLLPAGSYSVTEDEAWAYRYNAVYEVYYGSTVSKDGVSTAVSVSQVGSADAKVVCTNTEKSGLKGWLWTAAHNENKFDQQK